MLGAWYLRGNLQAICLVMPSGGGAPEGTVRLDPLWASVLAPGWFLEETTARRTLCEIVDRLDGHLGTQAASASTSWLVAQVVDALQRRRIEAYLVPAATSGGSGASTGAGGRAAHDDPSPPPSTRAPKAVTTWIEIRLIGDDGQPVPSEEFCLELPDGSMRRGRLDASGLARVDGIDPGTCEISFPALDAQITARA